MPKLKQREIAYMLVDTLSVSEVLQNCKHLELLDIRGCWNVNLDEKFVKKFHKIKVVGPLSWIPMIRMAGIIARTIQVLLAIYRGTSWQATLTMTLMMMRYPMGIGKMRKV
ncbi:hypothetical protein FXO38_10916, partial [Capsicum annuum]